MRGVPTVMVFRNGERAEQHVGLTTKAKLLTLIRGWGPFPALGTLVQVSLLLIAIALVAAFVPGWRADRVNPADAMRA